MEFKCKVCDKKFTLGESLNQHVQAKHQGTSEKKVKRHVEKKHYILMIVIISILALSFLIYRSAVAPGRYDSFAKCLTEKGAAMYGAIEWCKYTQEQADMFGKSFKYLDYQDYKEGPNIKVTPTWVISDSLSGPIRLERVQPFQRLSELTGCKIE